MEPCSRIALVCIGKIGDMIVTRFAIRGIRSAYPQARILLITLERNRDLLRYERDVNQVRFFRNSLDIIPLVISIRGFNPDLLLDFNDNPSTTSTFLARFGGATRTVGFAFEKNRRFLTTPVEHIPEEKTHMLQRRRRIVEAIGFRFDDGDVVPMIAIGADEKREVASHLDQVFRENRFLVAVNLSAGNRTRYWPAGCWKELLKKISEDDDTIRFLLLSVPQEHSLAVDVATVLPPSAVLFSRYHGFHHFAAYIDAARLLISADTSAVHIASASGVPVLGLYPAVEWNYWSWRPTNTVSRVVRPKEGLVPDIQVQDVLDSFRDLVREIHAQNGEIKPPLRNLA